MTTASDCSLRPMPARWRMPSSLLRLFCVVSGSTQPAAARRASRMMAAPSCSGALLKNMFFNSSADTSAFTMVPVAMTLERLTLRWKMMSAPVRERDMSTQASTVSAMAISSSGVEFARVAEKLRPMRSSRRRSSGWKSTTSAIKPISTAWDRRK